MFSNVYALGIGRIFCGYASGINYVIVPYYLKEMAPIEYRGMLGSLNGLLFASGIFFSYCMGLGLNDNPEKNNMYWRYLLGAPIIFNILRVILFILIYKLDSP